ncbi:MAG TPA: SAM-dependent methyltransferase [Actinomycetes bacterium]|nr:SAM-dependent methyltransferase [Actinomycetes bacterium]
MADGDWTTEINTSVPNPARIYDYLLGGKDNFPADREVAEQVVAIAPVTRDVVRDNRAFLRRAVCFLTREAGIRQFIDLGSGLPTQGNVHEIAQAIAPDARVVYVDNDAIVVTHSSALLAGDNTVAIQADLREPDVILGHPEVRELIDFDQPIALLLVAVLHFIPDDEDPLGIVARFRDAVAGGSYLTISHGTKDVPARPDMSAEVMAEMGARVERLYQQTTASIVTRTRAQVERFFDGLDLLDPGLVEIQLWRPDDPNSMLPGGLYGGVGRKR